MLNEVYYYSKNRDEEIPVSEMSDVYVRRAFKKMILKENLKQKKLKQRNLKKKKLTLLKN